MLLHKKYGDIFEVYFAGQRTIILCNTGLIENMNVSSTKTKYPYRLIIPEGFKEYGLDGTGLVNNTDPKNWKYNRQFFTQAMMTPSFNHQAVEWTNELWLEMESYWNNLGENRELDLLQWMHRFTNEMIFRISTGVKNNCVYSYYHTLMPEDNTLSEEEKEKIKESENVIQSLEVLLRGIVYFFIFNRFMRHYIPFISGKVKSLLKNRDYFFDKLYDIIKKRRIEIDNTPLDQPLRHDMLTSYITANTPRDINFVRHGDTDDDLLRPMTDKQIMGNILDAMGGGTDTTANLLCFTAYYLGHYPDVKRRLRQEFDEILGNDFTKSITKGLKLRIKSTCHDTLTANTPRDINLVYTVATGFERDTDFGNNKKEYNKMIFSNFQGSEGSDRKKEDSEKVRDCYEWALDGLLEKEDNLRKEVIATLMDDQQSRDTDSEWCTTILNYKGLTVSINNRLVKGEDRLTLFEAGRFGITGDTFLMCTNGVMQIFSLY
ncbi:unnamed protein product [Rhizophagus irregularis]|nr:unnamed protein product [Rhizophagus irregularis]